MKIRFLVPGVIAGTVAAMAAGLALSAVPASASSAPTPHVRMGASALVQYQLYANGGSTATWISPDTIGLESTSAPGASAQIDVTSAPSAFVPNIAPTFTSSPASEGGDPRWAIELHNGSILFGYGTADGWSCSYPAVTGTYDQAAAACVTGLDDWVTAAFVVDDSGEPGVLFDLTNVQYDGVTATEPAWSAPSGLHQTVYATSASLAWGNPAVPATALNDVAVWNRATDVLAKAASPAAGGHDRATGLTARTAYCWHVRVEADPAHLASAWSAITCFKTS